jgi:hypothetical protein
MKSTIQKQIDELKQLIESNNIPIEAKKDIEWGGADVIITNEMNENCKKWVEDQPIVISTQKYMPRRRLVVTKYSKELSWLFFQLREIFLEKINYISKYDFYGYLAQSAIDYLEKNENSQNLNDLLIAVLDGSKRFYEEELSE